MLAEAEMIVGLKQIIWADYKKALKIGDKDFEVLFPEFRLTLTTQKTSKTISLL